MSSPPPPPQVSPDGKFYWDGQRWVPMSGPQEQLASAQIASGAAVQVPAGYVIKKQSHTGRNLAIGCGGLIVAIITLSIIGSLLGGHTSGGSNSPGQTQNQTASSPSPTPSPVVLLDKSGSGINKTQSFTAAGDWQIDWSYDCSNFGHNGNFQIFVYNSDGSLADVAANDLGAKGSDTTYEHQGGTFYLQMNSECKWHVIVKG